MMMDGARRRNSIESRNDVELNVSPPRPVSVARFPNKAVTTTFDRLGPVLMCLSLLFGVFFFASPFHAESSSPSSFGLGRLRNPLDRNCVPRAMCFQTGVHCDFTKITLCDDGDYGGDRNEDDHNSRLSASDLMAWQAFYKTLAGHRWLACSRNLNTPCDCKDRVECQVVGNQTRIVAIRMPGNNARGPLPIKPLVTMNQLQALDLSTSSSIGEASVANKIYLKPCLALPRCRSEMVCAIAGVNTSTVQYCDQEGAHATTLLQQDLLAWSKFYQETGGVGWRHCSDNELTPCDCGKSPSDASSNQYVKCRVVNKQLRITRVHLPDNALQGSVPVQELEAWTALRLLDLSNTQSSSPNRISASGGCLPLPQCDKKRTQCVLSMTGLDLCSRKRRQLSLVPSSVLAGNGKTAKAEAMAFLSLRQSLSFATGWAECDSTVDPCNECTNRVQCESGEDGMHIVAMDLSNNRLFGELPENLTGFPHLRVLLLSNSNNTSTDGNIEVEEENRNELEFFQASCLDYAFCNQLGGRCESKDTKVHFCNEDGKLPANELEAWTGLFDGMNGIKWKRCSNARANPCAHPDCVHCDSSQGQQTITGIHLSSNNVALTALELPSLAALSNLVDLDLSLNSKLSDLSTAPMPCWNLPQRKTMKECKLPFRVCQV